MAITGFATCSRSDPTSDSIARLRHTAWNSRRTCFSLQRLALDVDPNRTAEANRPIRSQDHGATEKNMMVAHGDDDGT
jgi:hypothetical protein